MALVKPGGGIVDIRGKLAGTVFKRDGSGLHCVSLPRRVKKAATKPQKQQRYWYYRKKREEHSGGPPVQPYERPYTDGTAIIYSLEILWGKRIPCLLPPSQEEVNAGGFWENEILNWINNNWNPAWAMWGLSKNLMFILMTKWFCIWKSTWGAGGAVAFAAAKVNMMHFVGRQAACVAAPLLGLWAGLIGLGLFFAFVEWLEGQRGHISFTRGRVLIRKRDSLWWGNLVRRPSTQMYDFVACSPVPFESWWWHITADTPTYQLHWLYFSKLWQSVSRRLLWYYIYTWDTIRCRYRGLAYSIGWNTWRLQCPPSQREYWGHDVGWYIVPAEGCLYTGQFDDYFDYYQNHKPPL